MTLAAAQGAQAATIQVPCDSVALVTAVANANGTPEADTLELAAGCYYPLTAPHNTPANPNGLPLITTEIAIDGNGATIFRQSPEEFRILFVTGTGSLSLSDVTVQNGRENGFPTMGGAGILNDGGTVKLTRATLTSNYSPSGWGGGVLNDAGGTLTITDSGLLFNDASLGGAVSNAAGGTLTVAGSYFRGNFAVLRGGAIENDGGSATIVNSTFWDNRAVVLEGGALWNAGSLTLTHATVAANAAGVSGGNLGNDGTMVVTNSVVDGGENGNCSGAAAIADGGGNLRFPASDPSCPAGFTYGDPLLGAAADNGGATLTMKPGSGSAALDSADLADCALADQRGVLRPAGAGCDVGAFELAPPGAATGPAAQVVPDAATLTGTVVNQHAGSSARFEYGTSLAYGSSVQVGVGAATGGQAVSARLTGLTPSTTYHYRLVVTNADGTAESADGTFTTPAVPQPPSPPPPSPPPPGPPSACAGRPATLVASGPSRVTGTPRADVIVGTSGADTIDGGGGADVICAGGGDDRVSGGGGGDRVLGGAGADRLNGGAGGDRLEGGEAGDRLDGGAGGDRLLGGAGDDRLLGGAGADRLFGGAGRDRLAGGLGDDRLDGGSGADLLDERGQGRGRDTLVGGGGADRVFTAGGEPDRVRCGAGRDRVAVDRRDRVGGCERVRRP